jgi:hypothetical protein
MTTISVTSHGRAETRFTVELDDDDGSGTVHEIDVSDADWERFGGGYENREQLVEASVRFLLEREPKESILRAFGLRDIARYFPEYGEMFSRRSS